MTDFNAAIAENLKNIRKARGLSLDALATLTGVSKSMLGQIERLEVSPTITTMWKIAKGLKVNFAQLVQLPLPQQEIIESQSPIANGDGLYLLYPVFAFSDQRNFEMHRIAVSPGGRLDAEPHENGCHEYIIVFKGEITVSYADRSFVIKSGQGFRFNADIPHEYFNHTGRDCEICMLLSYQNNQLGT